MGIKVKKLVNVSGVSVPITIGNTTVYVSPGQILENVEVENYYDIEKYIRSEIDLSEIGEFPAPGQKKRRKLND